MIGKFVKDVWRSFVAPFRPRPPGPTWREELTDPQEKRRIVQRNNAIAQEAERIRRELDLIARDHGRH